MNIHIDQATVEVVRIDLGVAFKQGLTLKTAEKVCYLIGLGQLHCIVLCIFL